MIININPGHGSASVYRRGFKQVDDLDECHEGQNNFRIYELVKNGLEEYEGVTVTSARPHMDDDPSLSERGKSGKGADLQIALHSNAGGGRGPEILLRPDASSKADDLALAVRAALRRIPGLGTKNPRPLKYPRPDGKGGVDWNTSKKPGTAYYGELRTSLATDAIFVEMAFHDSLTEARVLRTKRQEIADAIVGAVAGFYGLKKIAPPEAPQDHLNGPYESDGTKLWFRAVAGSYDTRRACEEAIAKLKSAGYKYAWMEAVKVNGQPWFRAHAGSHDRRRPAEAEVQKLIKDGYKGAWLQAVYLPIKE